MPDDHAPPPPDDRGPGSGAPDDGAPTDDDLRAVVGRLADEADIRRVVLRYCRGVDRLDAELVRSCYHEGARDEHGSFEGTVDELVAWSSRLLGRYGSTMHLVANLLVEVAGDVALAETYGIAHHRGPEGPGVAFDPKLNLTTGFRFVDRFERRGGRWAIAHRVATTEWARVDDEAGRWPVPGHLRRGSRDEHDPVRWLVPEVTGPAQVAERPATGYEG